MNVIGRLLQRPFVRLGRGRYSSFVDFAAMDEQSNLSDGQLDPERKARIERNIDQLQQNIARLYTESGRTDKSPLLIAVSKKIPVMDIKVAYDIGIRHFGESYVQELEQKIIQFPIDTCWHFIGHLQQNKIAQLAKMRTLYMVQTVDSVEKAIQLDFHRGGLPKLRVMVQVNTSGEPSKHGIQPDGALELAQFIAKNCWNLRFKGFMAIGSLENSQNEQGNPDFECLIRLRERALRVLPAEFGNYVRLSMGMSIDYPTAIRMGSNYLRIGTAIFGERQ